MQDSFTPPKALSDFMHSLSTPAPATPPAPPQSWPDMNATGTEQHQPPLFPPSPAWLAVRDAYVSHIMACRDCVTHSQKSPRLCPDGQQLQAHYNATPYTTSATSATSGTQPR
ncbi:TPA: hypothetical protein KEY88_003627 [Serratia marcescens]|nr:hypothetical protein [Serratia marcescens]